MEFPKRDTSPPKPSDRNEILAGACGTCKTLVESTRAESAPPKTAHGFGDSPSAECPKCGARVYLSATGRTLQEVQRAAADTFILQEKKEEKGILDRMLDAMIRGEDIEISETEEAELERLAAEAEKAETDRFLLDD